MPEPAQNHPADPADPAQNHPAHPADPVAQPTPELLDVLIVGAGISGIDVAYRVQERCPDLSYAIVEAREAIGGTWDLFRYPGIRSDSDIFTLAYPFHPWTGTNAIVEGQEIRDYLHEVVDRHGIAERIRFRTRVIAADWRPDEARWRVRLAVDPGTPEPPGTSGASEPTGATVEQIVSARFFVVCTGYYDDEHPYDPHFAGRQTFAGTIVHPQHWPPDLDCHGKRVAVIGSGATAITLVPALVQAGARVTMVQRTPTYVLAQPRRDHLADRLRAALPGTAAHHVIRAKNTLLQWGLYQACRRAPDRMRGLLRRGAVAGIGSEQMVQDHFSPPYGPWEQRLCIAPGGDFFAAIRGGGADVVTGAIETFTPQGLRMADGRDVPADVIVTATGLQIRLLGGIELTLAGAPVDPAHSYVYNGAMLSGLPNLAFVIGYINLSWTVRSDLSARLIARVLRRLVDDGMDEVTPVAPADPGPSHPMMDMPSGYLARAAHLMPRATDRYPWAVAQNVLRDSWHVNRADLDDGLRWRRIARGPVAGPAADLAGRPEADRR